MYSLVWTPRGYAKALGREVQLAHIILACWISFLWMLYPICWGVSEGGNVIPPDSEFIFYGILDCCLIPITCGALLWLHRTIDPGQLGLYIRTYNDPVVGRRDAAFVSGGLGKPKKPPPGRGGTTKQTNGDANQLNPAAESGELVDDTPAPVSQETA